MLISFSFEKNFLYILLFSPLYFFRRYLNEKVHNNNLQSLIDAISKILLIIFYIIEKIESKTEKEKYREQLNKSKKRKINSHFINLQKNNKKQNYKKIILLLILCSNIFDIASLYLKNKCKLIKYSKCTDVILIISIDLIFFQNHFYSHQIISVNFGIIIMIILFIIDFNKFMSIHFYILFLLSYGYGFSLFLIKYINTKYFISTYLLGSFIGIFQSIFHTIKIYFIVKEKIIIEDINFYFIILYLINCLFINYLFYYIISNLTPIHSLICYNFAYIIIDLLKKENFFIEIGLLEIFPLISTFIYLEIIEINFCGLNENLKKNIKERELSENQKNEYDFKLTEEDFDNECKKQNDFDEQPF